MVCSESGAASREGEISVNSIANSKRIAREDKEGLDNDTVIKMGIGRG
jgi:hypothetical protein